MSVYYSYSVVEEQYFMKCLFSPHAAENYNKRINNHAFLKSTVLYNINNYVHTLNDTHSKSDKQFEYHVYAGTKFPKHAFLLMRATDCDTSRWPESIKQFIRDDVMFVLSCIDLMDDMSHHTNRQIHEAYRRFNLIKKKVLT
jgi:hypothetical protein